MKNELRLLAKSVLIPLELIVATSAANAGIHKKILGSGMSTLIISNKKMNDIIKLVKTIEESGLLVEGVSKTIKNEVKEQKGGFFRYIR